MAAMAISVVYLLAVHTYAGQLADTRAMLDLAEVLGGAPWPDAVLLAITPATALLAACSLALFAGMVHGVRAAAVVLFTSAGTAVGAVVLKALLVRPQLLDDAANSLPSGHVAVVAGLAAAAAAVAAPCHRILVIGLGLLGVS